MRCYNEGSRLLYVCDSFAGLPPGKLVFGAGDMNWDNTPYLEVNSFHVANNFHSVSMLDPNVIFVQGFFNNSMPNLRKQVRLISLLRLDGDIYESTVDVLYHLYDKVVIGGFIIIDDWNKDDNNPPTPFPAKIACLDFFKVHNMSVEIISIDPIAIYWRKNENIEIQYWRYEQKKFQVDS
jgi:8-demethyl-8-(2,3-dimethoxy-alpha-L-rhamnosyl)tetracenomycin-C 4'-O-methyltransferase